MTGGDRYILAGWFFVAGLKRKIGSLFSRSSNLTSGNLCDTMSGVIGYKFRPFFSVKNKTGKTREGE